MNSLEIEKKGNTKRSNSCQLTLPMTRMVIASSLSLNRAQQEIGTHLNFIL